MEDAHTTLTSYGDTGASFFAVFDGHGGKKIDSRWIAFVLCNSFFFIGDAVAKYCGTKLYQKIIDTPAFIRGRFRDAIRSGYYGIDEDIKKGKGLNIDFGW